MVRKVEISKGSKVITENVRLQAAAAASKRSGKVVGATQRAFKVITYWILLSLLMVY